ncbi:BREX system P-loop protein BrxC [Amycolatopsis sp. NPDC059021]|uniref:BREX system P-loop protein BrxC n=1 Tax=Amycolatopsis sp. NPDC059021 TaxID=3346704 RepID=UPI00366CE2B1
MQLSEIFAKDIQRPIEGVIKADDVAHLGTEVEEYVLTNEAAKGLELLLEEYTSYTNANGVWISGFFGSGKSHMLKMLAHLLGDVEGQDYPRQSVSDSFRAKSSDAFLPGLLNKADRIPAKSLLFNIDQKANLISKDQTDALLKVFVKVFDESCGYYGNHGHVARFERDLDNRGQYAAFQSAFERIAGIPWTQGREQSALEGPSIDQAFAEVNGGTADSIIQQYSASYSVSIDDFANEVKAWLDKQGDPTFRLAFFVDEVGQFIGSDTKLMLNLQTITESLNTRCSGRAWVFVTSQEDMDKVIGDRTRQQGNDFSKIQARFKTRLKLTSADVEEVIRKRLLEKNDAGAAVLSTIHADQHANFKTLFDFVDGAKTYRNYTDESHFVGTYPFVSYQFPLFQAAIEGLSDHNVFEGRNRSVGERSLLGVVQQVAKDVGNVEVGKLATFDSMFAGIRAALKSAAQRSIDVAERNLDNPLAVRLLKALFLVKYVESFQATRRNLTVLVYDHFGLDLPALSEQVKEALTVLEAQTYIQRNGNAYEYLTNEEQVIEEEIKNVDIDDSEISARLFKMLSGDVIKTNKIRYVKNGQDFPFGFKLDDQAHGPQRELAIHFISPEYPHSPEEIRMHSAGKDELRVILEPDARVLSDLRLLVRTEKYIKRKQSNSISVIEGQILQTKGAQNIGREKELIERVKASVGKSSLVINAADITPSSQDALVRVTDGFQDLVSRTYSQLKLLGGTTYSEQQVAAAVKPDSGLFDADTASKLFAPTEEVLSFVLRKEALGEQVTIRTIVDSFTAKPYGWDLASIEVLIAFLVGTSKLTLTVDGNVLKRSEAAAVLRNTQKHAHVVVSPQKTFDEHKVAAFRKFCTDFFDEGNTPKDPLELARHGADKLKAKRDELNATITGSKYPFVAELSTPIALLDRVVGKPDDWYLTDFNLGDDLLDAKDSTIDPIQAFLSGGQKVIYDQAVDLLATHSINLGYLPSGSDTAVRAALDDPNAFRGSKMAQLKQANDQLRAQIDEVVASNCAEVVEAIEGRKAEIKATAIYAKAALDAQKSVLGRIDQTVSHVRSQDQIALIREIGSSFEASVYPGLLDLLAASTQGGGGDDASPPKQTVSVKAISATGVSGVLETEEDVDRYLAALRTALVQTLNDGKRISL